MNEVKIKYQVVELEVRCGGSSPCNEQDRVLGEFDTESLAEMALQEKISPFGSSYYIRKVYEVRTIRDPKRE